MSLQIYNLQLQPTIKYLNGLTENLRESSLFRNGYIQEDPFVKKVIGYDSSVPGHIHALTLLLCLFNEIVSAPYLHQYITDDNFVGAP